MSVYNMGRIREAVKAFIDSNPIANRVSGELHIPKELGDELGSEKLGITIRVIPDMPPDEMWAVTPISRARCTGIKQAAAERGGGK